MLPQPTQQQMPPQAPGQSNPDEVMAAHQDAASAGREAVATAAPEPKKAFSVAVMVDLLEEFKKTIKALFGDKFPADQVVWTPPQGSVDTFEGPLPDPIFPAMVAINEVLEKAGPEYAKKYGFDPQGLVDDGALRKAQAQLRRIGKDKKLKEVLNAGPEESDDAADPPTPKQPAPEDMTQSDSDIMQSAKNTENK